MTAVGADDNQVDTLFLGKANDLIPGRAGAHHDVLLDPFQSETPCIFSKLITPTISQERFHVDILRENLIHRHGPGEVFDYVQSTETCSITFDEIGGTSGGRFARIRQVRGK